MSPPDSEGKRSQATHELELHMRHFTLQNLHEIPDAEPCQWATVHSSDIETFSELSRNAFHLVDMSGEVWTMRRAA